MEIKENLSIKAWAEEDRPREKLLEKGRHTLTEAELIAILIGSGTREESAVDLSKKILAGSSNNLNELGRQSVHDLMKFKGIGEAKAISIVAALELGRRRKEAEPHKRFKISSSADAASAAKELFLDLLHEEFWVLMLNRANEIIKKELISRGGVTGTVVDPRLIFKSAVQHLACSLILCHNHPSGNLKPSDADVRLTKKIREAGVLLEIPVLDHLIVTDKGHFSFADEGMM